MLSRLIQIYPVRYTAFFMVLGLTALSLLGFVASDGKPWLAPLIVFTMLAAVGFYDLWQSQHAVLRNYPIIGHLRFMLEAIRPELRQYFLESDTEAVPFSRAQRSLVYARAKGEPDTRPFGTQLDVCAAGLQSPSDLGLHHFMRRINANQTSPLSSVFPSLPAGVLDDAGSVTGNPGLPEVFRTYWDQARAHRFNPAASR